MRHSILGELSVSWLPLATPQISMRLRLFMQPSTHLWDETLLSPLILPCSAWMVSSLAPNVVYEGHGSHRDDHIHISSRTSWPDSYANKQPLPLSIEDKTPDVGVHSLGTPNELLSPVNTFNGVRFIILIRTKMSHIKFFYISHGLRHHTWSPPDIAAFLSSWEKMGHSGTLSSVPCGLRALRVLMNSIARRIPQPHTLRA